MLALRLQSAFQVGLAMRDMFDARTIEGLARLYGPPMKTSL